jgi:hypothetical protein
MDDAPATITLEVRVEGDTLSGRAFTGTDRARSFDGWLGLVAAIDALVSTRDDNQSEGVNTCLEK